MAPPASRRVPTSRTDCLNMTTFQSFLSPPTAGEGGHSNPSELAACLGLSRRGRAAGLCRFRRSARLFLVLLVVFFFFDARLDVFARLRSSCGGQAELPAFHAFWRSGFALLGHLACGVVLRQPSALRIFAGVDLVDPAHMRNLRRAPTPPTPASRFSSSMNRMRAAV